jgi:hypothetical protein
MVRKTFNKKYQLSFYTQDKIGELRQLNECCSITGREKDR